MIKRYCCLLNGSQVLIVIVPVEMSTFSSVCLFLSDGTLWFRAGGPLRVWNENIDVAIDRLIADLIGE